AIDDGRRAWNLQILRLNAAPFQHGGNSGGILTDILRVARQVGDGKQRHELGEDGLFVLLPPGARGLGGRICLRDGNAGDRQQKRKRARHFTLEKTCPRIFTAWSTSLSVTM